MADPLDERLKPLRDAIDAIDGKLVELLNERARVAAEVGRIKHEVGAPVFRPEREAEVLRKVAARSAGPLGEAALSTVFREVMSACRALERALTVAYPRPAGHVLRNRHAEAVRIERERLAVHDDRRGVPRDGGRPAPTSASSRSRTLPKARSAARSTCCSPRRCACWARCRSRCSTTC